MKASPIVACDIDGVLCDVVGPLVDYLSSCFGVELHPDEIGDWDNVLNLIRNRAEMTVTTEAWVAARREFWTNDEIIGELPLMLPMLTALRAVRGMAKAVHVVTERDPAMREITRLWLDSYGIPYDQLVFRADKSAYCRENFVRYIIEDDADQARSCHGVGVGVFLLDAPYNRNMEPKGGIWRISAPMDIPYLLDEDMERRRG